MREITNYKWTEKYVDKKGEAKELEGSLVDALSMIINSIDPSKLPRGIDKFRTYGRITKVFDKAKKNESIILEDADYIFIKNFVEADIPMTWGGKSEVLDAIEAFLSSKAIDPNEGKE